MTLEPSEDTGPKNNQKQSYALKRKTRIKRRNQLIRKAALEEKQRMFGTLNDTDRGRLRELQDTYD